MSLSSANRTRRIRRCQKGLYSGETLDRDIRDRPIIDIPGKPFAIELRLTPASTESQRRKLTGWGICLSAEDPLHGEAGKLVAALRVESPNAHARLEVLSVPEQYWVACDAHRN